MGAGWGLAPCRLGREPAHQAEALGVRLLPEGHESGPARLLPAGLHLDFAGGQADPEVVLHNGVAGTDPTRFLKGGDGR
jgi:hypothetical protein